MPGDPRHDQARDKGSAPRAIAGRLGEEPMQDPAHPGDAAVRGEQPEGCEADQHPAGERRDRSKVIHMIFRQLFDPQSSTYTYLLAGAGSREAVLIDPVFEQARRDAALIDELGLKLAWTLETHVHADHVTAAWLLREKLGSRIALSRSSGADGADKYLESGDVIRFGKRHLEARSTPG